MACQDNRVCGIRAGVFVTAAMVGLAVIVVIITVASIYGQKKITGPGLMYEPYLDGDGIVYDNSNFPQEKKSNPIIDRMKMVMKHYDIDKKNVTSLQHLWDCNPDTYPDTPDEGLCLFKREWIGVECSEAMNFGYGRKPCIFLLFNEIEDWRPDTYQSLDELPENMPMDLRDHITEVTEINSGIIPKVLWIHCAGEQPADREYIGPLRYYSPWNGWHGIPAYYFPYLKREDYYPPIFSIQLENLESDYLVHVECKAWAKNVFHSKDDGLGGVIIKILRFDAKKRK